MKKLIEKANVLIEALPFIRNFYGKTFVIKYGGAAQVEESLKDSFAQDVVLMNFIGIKPVIVHGGGPKVSQMMKKMGKEPLFVEGQRITDKETMDIVEMVLGGLINKEIVALINSHGGRAAGLGGKNGGLLNAKKKILKRKKDTGDEEIVDIGLVGEGEDLLVSNWIPYSAMRPSASRALAISSEVTVTILRSRALGDTATTSTAVRSCRALQ